MRRKRAFSIGLLLALLGVLHTLPLTPIQIARADTSSTVVVVEAPSLTPAYGPICETAWYRYTNNRGHYAYLTLNTNDPAQSMNAGRWTPNLPQAGRWRVEAFVPSHSPFVWPCTGQYISWDTSDARYKIHYNGGSHTISANQRPLFDGWLDLGVYEFAAGSSGYVELSDLNGEANFSFFISFSAVRFVWIGEGGGSSVVVEDPGIHPGYGGGMCDSAWYRYTNNRGHYTYLTLNTNDPAQSTNWAQWTPNLPQTGNYEVEAYIADHDPIQWQCPSKLILWDTSDARYTIHHADGENTVSRDQAPLANQWLNLGTYRFNAGTSGWVRLTDLNGEPPLEHTVSFSAMRFTYQGGGGDPPDVKTLILTNRERLAAIFGESEASRIVGKLDQLAGHSSVQGKVIQVENDAAVAAAYDAWIQNPTKVGYANHVTNRIHDLIDGEVAAHPEIRHIVIVGEDRVVPFRRVPDQTDGSESKYSSHVSANTTVGSALRADMILSDNFYADKDRAGWHGYHPYIPDLAIGRLIEYPDEIVNQIDLFLASDGRVPTNAGAVGADIIKDAAREVRDIWQDEGLHVDTCISDSWGRDLFTQRILNQRHDMVSLNHHANHYLISAGNGEHITSHHISASSGNHTQSLFFSLGCHSGLNVPPENPVDSFDLPQVFLRKKAMYIGNTGYGLGSRFEVAYSERLMVLFADLVYRRSLSIGQALTAAKRTYCFSEGSFDAADEKVVLEAALYGLPMYEFHTGGGMAAPEGAEKPYTRVSQEIHAIAGLTRNSVSYEFPAFTALPTDEGVLYLLADELQIDDGTPIQPRVVVDASFAKTFAHGVVFRGGVYTDIASFDPVVDLALTSEMTGTEPTFTAPGWYPAMPYELNPLDDKETVVLTLGQFHPGRNTERLYSQTSYDIYYHDSSTDRTVPACTGVSSLRQGGNAHVSVEASDASGIHTVVVASTDGMGTWESVELVCDGTSWKGTFPATMDTLFFVQVVDGAGNVAVNDNGGHYFRPGQAWYALYLPLIGKR